MICSTTLISARFIQFPIGIIRIAQFCNDSCRGTEPWCCTIWCLFFFGSPRTSRIRAMWTAVSSPQIRSLFKTTRLAFWASRVVYSRGGEIWTLDLTDPNHFQKFWTVAHMAWSFFIAVRSHFSGSRKDSDEPKTIHSWVENWFPSTSIIPLVDIWRSGLYITGSQETLSSISFHSELNPKRAAHCSI